MKTLKSLQKFGWLPVLLLTAQLSHGQVSAYPGAVVVDENNGNNGGLENALRLGSRAGGEGIASKRTGGDNQYGLEFITAYTRRMSITNTGNVGIGITTPTAPLMVKGSGPIGWPATAGTTQTGQVTRFLSSDGQGVLDIGSNGGFGTWLQSATPFNLSANFALLLNPNGGSVGIGTTAPALNLDVVGSSLGLRNGAAWDHLYFTHDGSTATMRAGGAETGLALQVGISATGTYGDASQNYRDVMRLLANGNVGIGTTTPAAKLEISNGTVGLQVRPGEYWDGTKFVANNKFTALDMAGLQTLNVADNFTVTGGNVGIGTASPAALLDVAGNTRLNGGVLIGLDITRFTSALAKYPAYGLWVEKGVVASDFAIAAPTAWADFVFAPGYCLPSLSDTEHYIRQYGHLPDMPSEASVKNNGYTLHEMNTRLLQKVEELTLHAIEQEKQLAETRALLQPYALLAAEVASLKARLEK